MTSPPSITAASQPGPNIARMLLRVGTLVAVAATALQFVLNRDHRPATLPIDEGRRVLASLGLRELDQALASPASPAFEDVTAEAGLTFVHDNDAHGRFDLPEQIGPGAAFVDVDADGDLDIFVTGGGSIRGDGPAQHCVLYRNDAGRFTDVTADARAGVPGPAYGVACADIDGDGDVDIVVTRLHDIVLMINDGKGRFDDATEATGIRGSGFCTGAAFFDYDKDGLLDLYVCRYVDWQPDLEQPCFSGTGLRDYCSPSVYKAPSTHLLFRNLGSGRFEDVSHTAGISAARGNGLGVVAADFDGDGWTDIYVANDTTPAFLWRNRGDGTFENVADARGSAYDGQGVAIAGMGVSCADVDEDGDDDLLITNIRGQSHLALRNDRGYFQDVSSVMGVAGWSMSRTGFGVAVFDQDNDGRLDACVANGAINATTTSAALANPYLEKQQFLRLKDGRWIDASSGSGADVECVGRAVAAGDYDNDGDVDLLVTGNGGALHLFRNTADRFARPNAWLTVDVRDASGRAPAIGARVEARAGDSVWRGEVRPATGYLSSFDPRVHFGLGAAGNIDRLIVTWLDGRQQAFDAVPVNRIMVVAPDAGKPPP